MRSVLHRLGRVLRRPFHLRYARAKLRAFHASERSPAEIVHTAMHFGGKGDFQVRTYQVPAEITALAEAVRDLHPERIVEIGTDRGGTLFIWAQLASKLVISCDLTPPGPRIRLYEAFVPPGSACQVRHLSGDSHQPAFLERVRAALGGQPIDFLFIDGDHTEDGVQRDYELYRGLVRPGGLIAFHDIVERQPLPTNQVYRFWRRLRPQVEARELVGDPLQCGFGIGVVRVPQSG